MKSQPGAVWAVPTDITSPEQVKEGFRAVRQAFGPVDMLINHAGNATWAPLQDLTPDQFSEAWRVGPYAGFLCTKEVVPAMVHAGHGVILFSGATSSVRGRGGASAFSSAKFGVRGLAESLARELWPKGIHVAHAVIDGVIGPPDVHKDSAVNRTEPT
jgi:NAD(P)-dependent dehydrogenase (short-subunit alcohol dehydrogenase family)